MARGLNKVMLIGHLGKDPEAKSFPNGGMVANTSLATSESWTGKDGQRQEHTEWHNLVFNDKGAEIASKYLRKGSKVFIEGKIRTRKYQDREGKERYITEIRVLDMQMLDNKPQGDDERGSRPTSRQDNRGFGSPSSGASSNVSSDNSTGAPGFDPDDDIPF